MRLSIVRLLVGLARDSEGQAALLGGHTVFGAGDFSASLVDSKEIKLLMMLKDEPSAEYLGIPTLKGLYNLGPR